MNNNLLENLLYQEESESLDFKRDQYRFKKESDEIKSELLKDILAFANSWRNTDAHILIGVQEIKASKSKIYGINEHLLNRNLQQFVNSKINRPLKFTYREYKYENSDIAIITIPQQERPFFLEKDYGKLEAREIYIRRSETTATADPDEVAKMGKVINSQSIKEPDLKLQLANLNKREVVGTDLEVEAVKFQIDNISKIPDYGNKSILSTGLEMYDNKDYYREMAKFLAKTNHIFKYGLVIKNDSETLAENVLLTIENKDERNLELYDEKSFPSVPHSNSFHMINFKNPMQGRPTPSIDVNKHGNAWHLECKFGNIQPGTKSWSKENFYLGTSESNNIELNAKIVANNLRKPIKLTLSFSSEVNNKKLEMNNIDNYLLNTNN